MNSVKIKRKANNKKNKSVRKCRYRKKIKGGAAVEELTDEASGLLKKQGMQTVSTPGVVVSSSFQKKTKKKSHSKSHSKSPSKSHSKSPSKSPSESHSKSPSKEIVLKTDPMPDTVFGATKALAKTIGSLGLEITKDGIIRVANAGIELILPNLEQQSIPEAKQELKHKLYMLNEIAKFLAKDPEVKAIIKETGDNFEKLTGEIVTAAQPAVIKAVDAGLEIGEEIGEETGRRAVEILTKTLMSALAEIPAAGGVADAVITVGSIFNAVAKNVEISSRNLEKMITMLNKLTGTSLSAGNEFIDKMQEINQKIFGAKRSFKR